MLSKLKVALGAIRILKNWPFYFLNYFGLVRTPRLIYQLKNGILFKVRPKTQDQTIFNQIWLKKVYGFPGFELKEGDVVVDIGAQAGFFSVYAGSKIGSGKAYAFEPEPNNFKLLKENISLNKLKNVSAYNEAVGEKSGTRDFVVYKKVVSAHSFAYSDPGDVEFSKVTVTAKSLEDFMRHENMERINFLKMDCEGAEYEILFNASEEVLQKIKKIAMEYHDIDDDRNLRTLKEFLEKKGFNVFMGSGGDNMIYAKR